ncbi:HPP family protein [Peribacillus saganii]|uniref:HPP family protein n=1 Tax=Peribacillus saganii TaxID=2303992 RepID=UPI0013148F1E
MAPFGASCVLCFQSLGCTVITAEKYHRRSFFLYLNRGLLVFHVLENSVWAVALWVGWAISCMVLTKTTHPSEGADPIVVILSGSHWSFLFIPAFFGALLIVLVALVINNLHPARRYQKF